MSFSIVELKIINDFLENKKSIREIADENEGFGRTKIRNLIEKYADISDENALEVNLRLKSQKLHREVASLEEGKQEELSEEQVQLAYKQITEGGKTLTAVASELNKNRETVKSAIIDYLNGDKVAINEFKTILKDNQKCASKIEFNDSMPEEEKRKIIYSRLNYRRKMSGKNLYSEELLERKTRRLMNFFEKRNSRITDEAGKISRNQLLKMMHDYPTMLSMSLNNKIKPVVNALDNNRSLGQTNTSTILVANPSILGTSIERTKLQLKILRDSNTLNFVLKKPRILRTSPELMYAQIELWKKENKYSNPFISTKKMYELYRKTPEQVQEEFNVEEKYGEDEYFDRM